jgi:hypothetical protein
MSDARKNELKVPKNTKRRSPRFAMLGYYTNDQGRVVPFDRDVQAEFSRMMARVIGRNRKAANVG